MKLLISPALPPTPPRAPGLRPPLKPPSPLALTRLDSRRSRGPLRPRDHPVRTPSEVPKISSRDSHSRIGRRRDLVRGQLRRYRMTPPGHQTPRRRRRDLPGERGWDLSCWQRGFTRPLARGTPPSPIESHPRSSGRSRLRRRGV